MEASSISEVHPGIYFYSNKKDNSDSVKKLDKITQNEIHKRTRGFKGILVGSFVGISCWAFIIFSIV